MADNVVDILLKFGVDDSDVKQFSSLESKILDIQKSINSTLEKSAKASSKQLGSSMAKGIESQQSQLDKLVSGITKSYQNLAQASNKSNAYTESGISKIQEAENLRLKAHRVLVEYMEKEDKLIANQKKSEDAYAKSVEQLHKALSRYGKDSEQVAKAREKVNQTRSQLDVADNALADNRTQIKAARDEMNMYEQQRNTLEKLVTDSNIRANIESQSATEQANIRKEIEKQVSLLEKAQQIVSGLAKADTMLLGDDKRLGIGDRAKQEAEAVKESIKQIEKWQGEARQNDPTKSGTRSASIIGSFETDKKQLSSLRKELTSIEAQIGQINKLKINPDTDKNIAEFESKISAKKQEIAERTKEIDSINKEILAKSKEIANIGKGEQKSLTMQIKNVDKQLANVEKGSEAEKDLSARKQALVVAKENLIIHKEDLRTQKAELESRKADLTYRNSKDAAIIGSLREQANLQEKIAKNPSVRAEQLAEGTAELEQLNGKLQKCSEEYDKIDASARKAAESSKLITSAQSSTTDAVKRTAGAMKGVLTEEQKAAKEALTDARNRASATYYRLRSLKMLQNTLKTVTNQVNAFESRLLSMATRGAKAVLKLALSFGVLHKSIKSTSKTHTGFLGSMKTGFMTILKYTLGIRSFYFLINKLRRALVDSMGALAQSSSKVNEQMSSIMSNVGWMKNMIATIAQPLLNVLVPAFDAVASACSRAASAIASFFATLTGQSFIYKAVKPTEDWAASLEKGSNAANKAIRSFDKLNVIQSKNGGGSGGGGAAFDEVEVEAAASELAKKVKDIFSTLFDPIKKAWDEKGKFVMDAWKYALQEVGSLIKTIGQDFLTVWSNETGVQIWKDIFQIVGDIGLIIGNLAHNLEEAWRKNDVGLHIFEEIQQIIAIIIRGIRDCADATVEWAKSIDFYPLLDSIYDLLKALKEPIQTLVNIVSYFYQNVLLPFKKYIIEEGLPLLLRKLQEIVKAVDWDLLESRMKKLMDAFEPFIEKLWEALAIVFEDLGKALADIVNSDTLGKIVDLMVKWMNDADPKEMAKAIEDIAKNLLLLNGGFKILQGIVALKVDWLTMVNVFKNAKVLKAQEAYYETLGKSNKKGIRGAFSSLITSIKNYNKSGKTFGTMMKDIGAKCKTAALNMANFVKALPSKGVAGVFTSIKGGVEGVRAAIGPVGQAFAGILGGIAEFKLLSSSVKELVTGTNNWATALKLVLGTVAGFAGLTLMLGFPNGPIAAGIIGITAAVKGLFDAIEEINAQNLLDSLTEEVEGATYSFDDLEQAVREDVEKITGNLDELNGKFQTLDDNRETFENLKGDVLGIVGAMQYQTNITSGEIDTLVDNIGELKRAWEEYISSQYDAAIAAEWANLEYLKTQEGYTEEVQKQALERIAKLTDEKNVALDKADAISDALMEELQAYDGTTESLDRINSAYEAYVEASGGTTQANNELADSVNKAKEGLDDLDGSLSLATENISSNEEYLEAWKNGISGTSEVLKGAYTELQTAMDENQKALDTANDDTKATFEMMKETLQSQMTEIDTETQNFANILQTNVADQGKKVIEDALADWESMDWYKKIPYYIAGQDAEDYAYQQFETFSADVINGENGIASMLTSELEAMGIDDPSAYVWIDEYGNNVKEKLWSENTVTDAEGMQQMTHTLATNWQTVLDGVVTEVKPEAIGEDLNSGLLSGVTQAVIDTADDYKKTFAKIEEYARDETDTHSPSTKFYLVGLDIVAGLKNGLDTIKDAIGSPWDTLQTKIDEIISKIQTSGETKFNTMSKNLQTASKTIQTNVNISFTTLKTQLITLFGTMKTKLEETTEKLRTKLTTTFNTLSTNLKKTVETLTTNLIGKFTTMKDTIGTTMDALKTKMIDVFEAIKTGIKSPLNGIIDLVDGLVNRIIDGVNGIVDGIKEATTFSWTNPLTNTTHSSSGISLGKINNISIPRLAKGAVIPPNSEFLALLGDQKRGTNIEAPLDTLVEAFNKAGGNSSEEELRLLREQNRILARLLEKDISISGRDIFNTVKSEAKDYYNRTGNPAFI